MKKYTKRMLSLGIAVVVLSVSMYGCGQSEKKDGTPSDSSAGMETESDSRSSEQMENTAMYVPYGDQDGYVMIDQNTDAVFTVSMPEEIYDSEGNRITQSDLKKGNILKITGNGIMLESYPGQYPGVTRIDVEKAGTPSDADQYQEVIDQIWQEPDSSQIPFLNVEYTTDLAAVSAAASVGSYEWKYPAEDGTVNQQKAEEPAITQWTELIDIRTEEPVELNLVFSQTPVKVTVLRWPETEKGKTEIAEGEDVPVQESGEQGSYVLTQAEPGWMYLVKSEWENGYAEYGFQVMKPQTGSEQ